MKHVRVAAIAAFAALVCGCVAERGTTSSLRDDELEAAAGPKKRFSTLVDAINQFIVTGVGDQAEIGEVRALALGGIRNELFEIQTMAELYSTRYPALGAVRTTSKAFEDQIGAYRQASEKHDFAVSHAAPAATIASLQAKLDQEANALLAFITNQPWHLGPANNKIAWMRTTLDQIAWDTPEQDRRFVFGGLCRRLMAIDDKTWDMFVLEAPFGLHNLRKAVRWYRLEIGLFQGDLVKTSPANCPNVAALDTYHDHVEANGLQTKICEADDQLGSYANYAADNQCALSTCYQSELDALYSLLGAIKDEAEGLHAIGQEISMDRLKDADELYKKVKMARVFRRLSYELKSCVNKSQ